MFFANLFLAAFARSLASPLPISILSDPIPSPVCVVAAALTASRCDPTRTRTIFDILYSCIGVILLCTYISIHHNIPDQGDSWAKVAWSKLRTTLYALVAPEMVITWAIRQRIIAHRIAKRHSKDRGWTTTHGFFIEMGGLVQQRIVGGVFVYQVICDTNDLETLKIPAIPEKEIKDHGKGDLLAKALVVVQTMWFVAQCIARRVQGLVLTEVELITLAFATLNVITYGLWWDKPLNIGYPIYFDENGIRVDGPLAASGGSGDDDGKVREWTGMWYERIGRSMKDCMSGSGKVCQDAWESMRQSWRDSLRRRGVVVTLWEKVIVAIFMVVFRPFWHMTSDKDVENRPTSVHPFYAGEFDTEDGYLAILYGGVIGILFGAIHLIGWNFQFPTPIELWLWRSSSLVLTVIPLLLAIGAAGNNTPCNIVFAFAVIFGAPLYFNARILLLVLAFFTLRDLPDSAYQNVRWTEYIPHI
ncbi:hypothetical protein AX16_010058 [Volvariella volvacea WC 439]|nr:hypothetical protein AX16_010058 [Volvariella volvacea WC 439]